jgi:hypothetical protein
MTLSAAMYFLRPYGVILPEDFPRYLQTANQILIRISHLQFINIMKSSVYLLVTPSSHMQIKSYVYDNVQNQELLTLNAISPMWAKKLK